MRGFINVIRQDKHCSTPFRPNSTILASPSHILTIKSIMDGQTSRSGLKSLPQYQCWKQIMVWKRVAHKGKHDPFHIISTRCYPDVVPSLHCELVLNWNLECHHQLNLTLSHVNPVTFSGSADTLSYVWNYIQCLVAFSPGNTCRL